MSPRCMQHLSALFFSFNKAKAGHPLVTVQAVEQFMWLLSVMTTL